ncbi:MAG: FeoB-associated Cys-rich membrane protein [Clostridia bacterium]|nr:FeoB-associated Cys-rich membrane protein [Clostridia bacterium]
MLGKIIAIAAIVLIVGGVTLYIIKAKKSGRKCIGCPAGCSCSAKNGKKNADGENSCCCSHKDE